MNNTSSQNSIAQPQEGSSASTSSSNGAVPVSAPQQEKEEILIESQFAFFFESPINKPEEFWQSIKEATEGIFDQTPIIVPVPNDPNLYDVPIVQMRSGNGIFRLNLARTRADFFYAGSGRQKFSDIQAKFTEETVKLLTVFSDIKIKRIGFVTRLFIEDADQDKTIKKLLKDEFTNLFEGSVNEVAVRYVTRTEVEGLKINDLTIIERFNARIANQVQSVKGLLITRDFNTVPEENYGTKIDAEAIKKLVVAVVSKFKLAEIKTILWPTKQ